jgi:serine/threonine-protein kinase
VAVKVLRRDYARDPALLPRFLEAAKRAAAVAHPSVAKVYDYGEGGPDDPPYIVTELIKGPALPGVIRGEAVRASFIASALAQVADGLHAAHRAGLVHGDLKPANILLAAAADRRAIITDFGITHALGAIGWAGNTLGTGTVLYLAPELVSGGPATPASDLYSLGIIAYEWLAGAPPFTGTSQQVMAAHLRGPLPRLPAAVPPGLAELVARLTAKDPASRLDDAAEAAVAARALARELRRDARDDAASFPAARDTDPDIAVAREEAVTAAEPASEAAGLGRLELASYKREVAWAASALIVAGLIGWAPSGSIQSAVKIVQLAVPAAARHPASPAGHPATGREHPGSGDGYSAAGDDGNSGPGGESAGRPATPAGQRPGSPASGLGGRRGWADGDPAPAAGGRPAGSGSTSPSATAPGRPAGSPAPRRSGPASPLPRPTSAPAPSTAPPSPSAPGSRPAPPPRPVPPRPVPPRPVPSRPLPSRPLPSTLPPSTPPAVPTFPVSVPPLLPIPVPLLPLTL